MEDVLAWGRTHSWPAESLKDTSFSAHISDPGYLNDTFLNSTLMPSRKVDGSSGKDSLPSCTRFGMFATSYIFLTEANFSAMDPVCSKRR